MKLIKPSAEKKATYEKFLKKTEMNLHVTVERSNPKMPHIVSPQLAQALITEKADCSLFNHRGKDQPPFLPPGHAVGCGTGRSLTAALAQGPSSSSLSASADGSGKDLEAP